MSDSIKNPSTDPKLISRLNELLAEGARHRAIAHILTLEGFVTKQGLAIDAKWVNVTAWQLRRAGLITAPLKGHTNGGGGKRPTVAPMDLDLIKHVLTSKLPDPYKVELLRSLFRVEEKK